MLPTIVVVAAWMMILGSVSWLWTARHLKPRKAHICLALGALVSGIGWLLPSEVVRALLICVGAVCSVVGAALIMIHSWRQARVPN